MELTSKIDYKKLLNKNLFLARPPTPASNVNNPWISISIPDLLADSQSRADLKIERRA
jgi:hypothetical protein